MRLGVLAGACGGMLGGVAKLGSVMGRVLVLGGLGWVAHAWECRMSIDASYPVVMVQCWGLTLMACIP